MKELHHHPQPRAATAAPNQNPRLRPGVLLYGFTENPRHPARFREARLRAQSRAPPAVLGSRTGKAGVGRIHNGSATDNLRYSGDVFTASANIRPPAGPLEVANARSNRRLAQSACMGINRNPLRWVPLILAAGGVTPAPRVSHLEEGADHGTRVLRKWTGRRLGVSCTWARSSSRLHPADRCSMAGERNLGGWSR